MNNISKIYPGNVKAVDSISLHVKDREFMVLVGPSGCGKSTILRMIAGLEKISCGEIMIGPRIINDLPPKDRDIAMVFQNYALYPHMNVYDNMAFGLKLRKLRKSDIDKRVRDAADILGLQEYLFRKPKALSGGQRQRVALGRAIVRDPEVFLFDEPLSNLDAKMRVRMRMEISKFHKNLESTMIYVTHDQAEAMTMGDRICVMKDGIIQQVADPITLYNNPENIFVAGFIGSPPMNFFTGRIISKKNKLFFHEETVEIPLSCEWKQKLESYINKDVFLGIRPENIGSEQAAKDPAAPTLEATLEVIEPMGSETYLHLNTGTQPFIARVDAHKEFRVGDKIKLPLHLPKIHIFDFDTEKTIL